MHKQLLWLLLTGAVNLPAQTFNNLHTMPINGGMNVSSIAFDGTNYEFWFYSSADSIRIDGNTVLTNQEGTSDYNAYYMKTDEAFNQLVHLQYWNNGPSENNNYGGSVASSSLARRDDGTLYLCFGGYDSLYLNGSLLHTEIDGTAKGYLGLAKLTPDNEISAHFFSKSKIYDVKIATLPDGRIVIAGYCGSQAVEMGDFVLDVVSGCIVGAVHDTDIIVAILDGNTGAILNARRFGGCYWDYFQSLAVTPDGSIILGGSYYSNNFQFENVSLTNPWGFWAGNAFLMSLDTNLQLQWYKNLNSKYDENTTAVLTDVAGNIFWSVRLLGDYALLDTDTIWAQHRSVLLFKLDSGGQLLFQKTINSTDAVYDYDAKLDNNGNLWYSLVYSDTVSFGGNQLISPPSKSSGAVVRIYSDGSYGSYYACNYGEVRQFRHIYPIDADRLWVMGYMDTESPFEFLDVSYTPPLSWNYSAYYIMGVIQLPSSPTSALPLSVHAPLQIWPSPAGAATVQVALSVSTPVQARLRVLQSEGRLIYDVPWLLQSGDQQYTLQVADLAPGVYRVVVDMGAGGIRSGSFVKE
jgi:hypothetical protein